MMKLLRWCIGVSAMCLLLAGCGTGSSGQIASGAQSPTATATAAATPTPSPAPTINPSQIPVACAPGPHSQQSFVQIGDLIVSEATFGLDYPAAQVPDGTPLNPYKLPNTSNPNSNFPNSPPVNPGMKEGPEGFVFNVCNGSSSQSHTLNSVSVKIAAFQPYSGQLNSWQFCDGYYFRPQGAQYGGCGGGFAASEYLHATFAPTDTTGATVTAVQSGVGPLPSGSGNFPPLPLALAPGKNADVDLGLTVPTTPGTYTFAFALSVDNAPPVLFSSSIPSLFAPVAHKWGGQACEAAVMQSQIPPATTPPAYYICPTS